MRCKPLVVLPITFHHDIPVVEEELQQTLALGQRSGLNQGDVNWVIICSNQVREDKFLLWI